MITHIDMSTGEILESEDGNEMELHATSRTIDTRLETVAEAQSREHRTTNRLPLDLIQVSAESFLARFD